MTYKPWQLFLAYPPNLEQFERERRMEKAGIGYTSSHDTEAEAKSAGEEVLRKLKQIDDTEWVVFYAEPYSTRPRPGGINHRPDTRFRFIRSSDLDD